MSQTSRPAISAPPTRQPTAAPAMSPEVKPEWATGLEECVGKAVGFVDIEDEDEDPDVDEGVELGELLFEADMEGPCIMSPICDGIELV